MIGDPGSDPDGARIHALDFGRHGAFLVVKGCVVCRAPWEEEMAPVIGNVLG